MDAPLLRAIPHMPTIGPAVGDGSASGPLGTDGLAPSPALAPLTTPVPSLTSSPGTTPLPEPAVDPGRRSLQIVLAGLVVSLLVIVGALLLGLRLRARALPPESQPSASQPGAGPVAPAASQPQ
jgi:hypothetical protein